MRCAKWMSYSVEYFVRKCGIYFYGNWNSDNEQRQKKMLTLYIVFFLSQYTDLFYLRIWFIFIDFSSDGGSPLVAMHL